MYRTLDFIMEYFPLNANLPNFEVITTSFFLIFFLVGLRASLKVKSDWNFVTPRNGIIAVTLRYLRY